MKDIIRALSFDTRYHKKQFRKGTRIPYMCHVLNVCKILAERDCPEELLIAALLHDLPEDTVVTLDEIEEGFGKRIAMLVEGASEPLKLEGEGFDAEETWRARKEQTIGFIEKEANYGQLLVILADKLDNIRSLRYDVGGLGEEVWRRFNAGRVEQQWYYHALLGAFQQRSRQSSCVYEELLEEFREGVEANIDAYQDLTVTLLRLLLQPKVTEVMSRLLTADESSSLVQLVHNLYDFFKSLNNEQYRSLFEHKYVKYHYAGDNLKRLHTLESTYKELLSQFVRQKERD